MKYYMNLIKNKKYVALIIMLIIALLGVGIIYFSATVGEEEGIFLATNLGAKFIGICFIYWGLIYLPSHSPVAQDDSEYEVESRGEEIYIRYKDYEYLFNKKDFKKSNLMLKEKNGKRISWRRAGIIYSYVIGKHKELLEKEIDKSKVITEKEIPEKFKGIKLLTEVEKQEYIKRRSLKNRHLIPSFIMSMSFFGIGIMAFLGGFLQIIERIKAEETGEKIVEIIALAMIILFTCLAMISIGVVLYQYSGRQKKLVEKIKKGKMYTAYCYSYDKKEESHADSEGYTTLYYYIKVTDDEHYIDKWFEVSRLPFHHNERVRGKLIMIDNGGEILSYVEDTEIVRQEG